MTLECSHGMKHTGVCRTGVVPSSGPWTPYLAHNVSVKPIYNLLRCQVRVDVIVLQTMTPITLRTWGLLRGQTYEPAYA